MNKWVRKSIELANKTDYLDKLHEVYPVTKAVKRALPKEIKKEIKQAYESKNSQKLFEILLRLKKFPIKDPYVAYLKKKKGTFLQLNPITVERIANILYSMSFEELIEGCEAPIEFNRQIGTLFRKWLHKLCYPFLAEQRFISCNEIAFLSGSNGEKKEFANKRLGCNLDKGPDLVAKVGDRYIIGEAKFLTDTGGHQRAQFQDALRLLRGKKGNAIRIAVLDGVLWIKGRHKMYKTVCRLTKTALTALLLKDFLESLRQEYLRSR